MEIESNQKTHDSRTDMTLENYVRMAFHPKGGRGFMEGMNNNLELGPIQSSMNKYIGTGYDILKYLLYATALGELAYQLFK